MPAVRRRPPPVSRRAPPLSVVILAAGEGKRMRSALPKVLQPLAGRPLLAHVLSAARSIGAAAIHVVYGAGGEQVLAAFQGEPLDWVLQEPRLGTGHAARLALQKVPDDHDVLILYGDVPLIRPATLDTLRNALGGSSLALLSVVLPDATGYGRVLRNAAGAVRGIVEEKDASARARRIREANTGVLVAPARLLRSWLGQVGNRNAQGEYYLTDVVGIAVRERRKVEAVAAPSAAEVLGVNDKVQLAELEGLLRTERARELMRAGVTVLDPARLDLRGEISCGSDVQIDVNVIVEGRVSLGDRVHIGPGCLLRDCSIGDDVQVHAHTVIDGAVIGAGSLIGPFARLRPGAQLGERVHIGNFVEVKNARLAADAKANHLAYVGDAELGERVNIGAGTIIANYDGVNKHRTVIGADVHTGSNSVLVAPIVVGAGATIGAGSTVTRQVPEGKLTVARARQAVIEHWKRPVRRKP